MQLDEWNKIRNSTADALIAVQAETARKCAQIAHSIAEEHRVLAEHVHSLGVPSHFNQTSACAAGIEQRIREAYPDAFPAPEGGR
jgi:hypothetical protein